MRAPLRFLATLLLLSLVAAAACFSADEQSATESKLKAFLVDKLGEDAQGIRVTVVKGKATLTGEVERRATEELAEEVALAYPGISRVKNDIDLAKSETVEQAVGGELSDGKLESTVKGALVDEMGRRGFSLEVEAVDGVVSLRGTVPDEARRKIALDATRKVGGVKQVIDLISVAK